MAIGVDSMTGKTLWRYNCPDGSHDMPAVISELDKVYIGCGRMVSALNPKNGQKIWSVNASNGMLGSCGMTMATVWGSRQAEM
jgi:outer membrane protein assembly factor BamB